MVRLSQPMGAEGQQPMREARESAFQHAAPDDRGPKLSRLKTVASGSGIGSANCPTRHRKPATNEDAASRRKRDDGARLG